jgi:hypothetical protein
MSSLCESIVGARRGFALGEDTIRNHYNFDEASVGESAFQFSKFLVIVGLHRPLNIVRSLALSSKSRAKQ